VLRHDAIKEKMQQKRAILATTEPSRLAGTQPTPRLDCLVGAEGACVACGYSKQQR